MIFSANGGSLSKLDLQVLYLETICVLSDVAQILVVSGNSRNHPQARVKCESQHCQTRRGEIITEWGTGGRRR